MTEVILLAAAADEADAAMDWYWAHDPAVGERFRADLGAAIQRIAAGPERWPMSSSRTRRVLFSAFPYASTIAWTSAGSSSSRSRISTGAPDTGGIARDRTTDETPV